VTAYFGGLRLLEFPTFTATWAYSQISLGMSSARRILDLMSRETRLDQNAAGRSERMRGEIEFRGVSFKYPAIGADEPGERMPDAQRSEDVLRGISFRVRPGQTVAIVGQTGAAKTTLVRLVNRTYDVTSGQVLVDGLDVRDWNLAALRSQISMIEQDIFLFSRSLRDNISFGRPEATREEMLAAAAAAQANEFISAFDRGYETVAGERGVTLSGGQRQRIALARAFLTDPRILILDDSTSAIDSETEDKIQRAIATAAQGRTTLIITHRLSQIRWADLILVLRKGEIAAMGTHEELMKRSEAYSRVFKE
jgi:ATP-binding cassette subfamily B protein